MIIKVVGATDYPVKILVSNYNWKLHYKVLSRFVLEAGSRTLGVLIRCSMISVLHRDRLITESLWMIRTMKLLQYEVFF